MTSQCTVGLLPRVVLTSLFLLVTHSSLVTVLSAQGGGPREETKGYESYNV